MKIVLCLGVQDFALVLTNETAQMTDQCLIDVTEHIDLMNGAVFWCTKFCSGLDR